VSTFKKAVIPAAGMGTRLLPITKELPKEMLPIFTKTNNGKVCLKPMLQAVFEQLYDVGFREFCFVVGREKRAIEDHFTLDNNFIGYLEGKNKVGPASELRKFYKKLENSRIMFVNQPEPKGFGDAVLQAKPFVAEDFLVHAGDTYIISPRQDHLMRLMRAHSELKADLMFIVQEVADPRQYGVIEAEEIGEGLLKVKNAIEKPETPPSNLAIIPIYIFKPKIFDALESIEFEVGGEVQLTDGIQGMINSNSKVYALKLNPEEVGLEIGTPETCWDALSSSYKNLFRF
jgi:UTP--glucose-1-phosphate uridylyltransferase